MKFIIRSILITSALVLLLLALLVAWLMSGRGIRVLTQPMRAVPSQAVAPTLPAISAVSTVATPSQQTSLPEPKPVGPAKETATQQTAAPSDVPLVAAESIPTEAQAAHPPTPTPSIPTSLQLPERAEVDSRVARDWLMHTNTGPAVVISYAPEEVVQLLRFRRGTLLATAAETPASGEVRVFCLAALPQSGRAEFVEASTVGAQLSKLGIVVHPDRGALHSVTSDLAAYFGFRAYSLQFIPDHSLAETIMTEVARACRAAKERGVGTERDVVVQGVLAVTGTSPTFLVSKLRTLHGEISIARGHAK